MRKDVLQINEDSINESFATTNNVFDEFRIFTSNLFSQITDWITLMFQDFLK